jgi:hypothetical protein
MASFRTIEWFFIITKTAANKGLRLRTGDRPETTTFADLLHSSTMRTESKHRAKDDTGAFSPDNNGHVVLATGAQVKDYEAQSVDRSKVVAPDQVTEVSGSAQTVGGTEMAPISVVKDSGQTRRNSFILGFGSEFLTLIDTIISKLLPPGGTTGQMLVKSTDNDYETEWTDQCCNNVVSNVLSIAEDIPDDADIVCMYDTTSFIGQARSDAQNLMETWFTNYISSKLSFQGSLIQLEGNQTQAEEAWLLLVNKYIDETQTWEATRVHKIWKPDGLGSYTNEPIAAITDPVNKKAVIIIFIDEANSVYHSDTAGSMQDPPTQAFKDDYVDFVNNQHAKFDFFRAILYGVQSGGAAGSTANLHSNVVQSIELSTLVAAPFSYSVANAAGFVGTELDFITADNFYEQAVDGASPTGYAGLRDLGWTYVVDMPNGSVDSVTNSQFAADIENALSGGDGTKTITITSTITLEDGTIKASTISFDVPI